MTKLQVFASIRDWSVEDKLALLEALWDDVANVAVDPVPEWHLEELRQAIAEADADPTGGDAWEAVRTRITQNL